MKKFGTPSGAGPGKESAYVGFAGVGTLPAPRKGVGLEGVAADGFDGVAPAGFEAPGAVIAPRPVCAEPAPAPACGAGRSGCDGGLLGRDGDGRGVVWDALVGEAAGGEARPGGAGWGAGAEHDPLTLATGELTGSGTEESGVPGATFTVTVTF